MKTIHFEMLVAALMLSVFICTGSVWATDKIAPGKETGTSFLEIPDKKVQASIKEIVEWYEAVGTIRPRVESQIESQVTAKVKRVQVSPGNKVTKDQVLVQLDDRQFQSRLAQAQQALKSAVAQKEETGHAVHAAEAKYKQALAAFNRTQKYVDAQAATPQDMEKAESAHEQAKAGVDSAHKAMNAATAGIRRAEEVVKEAQIALGYTNIRAPQDGEVLKKLIEPGDLALPGKPLIILQTSGALRLEAYVREGLIHKVEMGASLMVHVTTLNKKVVSTVEEIVPYADPQTRTFLVKVALPVMSGLYPGMYGKLLIPAESHEVVLIPQKAVRNVGQLELLTIEENGIWKTRYIKTGKRIGNELEVLSGLFGNEWIGMKE
ncbi:MAG: efflux RND transporter periplasmic adaptor subunit [Candidatus Magnetomorum sp.]|nr:efflux RND transporter periplasmic adaptor subunit [Candidatus Magnetomorum sp.]